MELTHEFTVPATIDETWAALNDIAEVAGCFPGATVSSVEGDTFHGSCKVKLGPIVLIYNGSGTFVEKDEPSHTMKIEAKGKDKRGNGTAGADVVATMTAVGEETTVRVVTDLAITGKPAQFGRGVMQDVSDKLLGQFVDCLETKVGADSASAADRAASSPTGAAAVSAPTGDPDAGPASAPAGASGGSARPDDDAIDLGATLLPVLVKSYGKQVAIGLGVIVGLVIIWRIIR